MSRTLPEPAPWIATLPTDDRGFHVPAEAGWVSGVPVLSKVATDRKVALGMRRACALCGYAIAKGSPVYRVWAQSDAAHMRQYEREQSHDLGGPLHLSCILYSAMVCPYLRERNSRLGKQSTINPGARRGTRAAVIGFEDFGLLVCAARHNFLDSAAPSPHFGYLTMVDDIPYVDGVDLADRYQAAVASDAGIIDVSGNRLFWTDAAADQKALGLLLKADHRYLQKAKSEYVQIIEGVGRFVAFPIP